MLLKENSQGQRALTAVKNYGPPLLFIFLLLFLFAAHFWAVRDDAYISFRYAKNWAQGYGLRYNQGVDPPVEGFSNFLWTALMAGIHLLGLDMVVLAPWISLILSFVLAGLVFRYLLRIFGNRGQVPLLGTLFLALFPPFCVWATGGLETMLFALLLFVAYERLLGGVTESRGWQAGTVAGLLALTRPEGLIWGIALGVLYFFRRKDKQEKIFDGHLKTYLLVFGAFIIIFLSARVLYFQKLLPNVAFIKLGLSTLVLKRGVFYVVNFFLTFITAAALVVMIPLLIFKIERSSSRRPILWRASVIIGGVVLFSIVTGGDFMAMGRFMVPAAPFLAILFATLVEIVREKIRWRDRVLLPLIGIFLLVHALPSFNLHIVPESIRQVFHFRWNNPIFISEYEQTKFTEQQTKQWVSSGRELREYSAGQGSLVCAAIGAIGYHSELFIYDQFGLVNAQEMHAAAPIDPHARSAGHDRLVPVSHFLKYKPRFIMIRVLLERSFPKLLDQLYESGLPADYELFTLPLEPSGSSGPGWIFVGLERKAETD